MLDVCSSASCILLLACRYRVRGDNISFTIKVLLKPWRKKMVTLVNSCKLILKYIQKFRVVFNSWKWSMMFWGFFMIDIYVYVNLPPFNVYHIRFTGQARFSNYTINYKYLNLPGWWTQWQQRSPPFESTAFREVDSLRSAGSLLIFIMFYHLKTLSYG